MQPKVLWRVSDITEGIYSYDHFFASLLQCFVMYIYIYNCMYIYIYHGGWLVVHQLLRPDAVYFQESL